MRSRKCTELPCAAEPARARADTRSFDGNCGRHLVFSDPRKGGERIVAAYRRDLMKFCAFAGKRKLTLEMASRDDLVDFLAGLYRQHLEGKSVARHLVSLRNFFRFAQIQELIQAD